MKLTMVGTGYVGLVTGACFATTGNDVTCLDIDEAKIATLRAGRCPIHEPGLLDLLTRNSRAGRLRFTSDRTEAYRDAEVIFICVGTPPDDNGRADLRYVRAVAGEIAEAFEQLDPDGPTKLVVVKSTVPVGTTHVVRDIIRAKTRFRFSIANNPEFLKEGAAVGDFMKPDRVICGADDEYAGLVMKELYEPYVRQGNPIFLMDVRSSEMVKYASNAMLACKISFINEIANLCERYGADVQRVREGMCADHRIGNQFLYPGLGYGGSCFPKDTKAVVAMGEDAGFDCKINRAVDQMNQDQRGHFWGKVTGHFARFGPTLPNVTLAFWGLAFKPETDDIREAPALTLIGMALESGARVRAFDPVAAANVKRLMPDVLLVDEMYETLRGCDALIVCTEWNEFRHPDFKRMAEALRGRVIFDGRNIFRRSQMQDLGFSYYSVGRTPVIHGQVVSSLSPRAG